MSGDKQRNDVLFLKNRKGRRVAEGEGWGEARGGGRGEEEKRARVMKQKRVMTTTELKPQSFIQLSGAENLTIVAFSRPLFFSAAAFANGRPCVCVCHDPDDDIGNCL